MITKMHMIHKILSARNTRFPEKFQVTKAKTNRLALSAIPTMQQQLNKLNGKL